VKVDCARIINQNLEAKLSGNDGIYAALVKVVTPHSDIRSKIISR